ncbi:hypothetical protein SAMN05444000_11791 [Shimia gijangensis]|uniref:DUF1178 family protein n=1 Tax=Shimia gijangensis TaxID=1470563 RepID=A0A1M6P7N9_9RHOB|nr:DUF1178 family protein [Shimia gijangensis]SHK03929.1 hypothetical protein SAMN05444000_11791 [Shimia gijangensis]
MIQYTLKCTQDHRFDSWFQSADAYDKLLTAGMIACSICGDTSVEKAMMAPRVRPARNVAHQPAESPGPACEPTPQNQATAPASLSAPANEAEQAIANMKKQVEENSDYVGVNFVKEARAMHDGDTPERSIYGEAKPEEAKALIEDGISVLPLPFRPGRKTN